MVILTTLSLPLRLDSTGVGKRTVVSAYKLPTALDAFLKGRNKRISLLKSPKQVYDICFETHFGLLTLHPFGAGNGLMTCLIMTYVQHYHHLPLSTVDPSHHLDFQLVLETSWQEQTIVTLLGFCTKS